MKRVRTGIVANMEPVPGAHENSTNPLEDDANECGASPTNCPPLLGRGVGSPAAAAALRRLLLVCSSAGF